MIVERWPAVVVGSGLAGMTAALSLAPLKTLVLTKTDDAGGSTPWAQGGVAFPLDDSDVSAHIRDTLVSGAGHTDPAAAEFLVRHSLEARDWLESQGVVFDHEPSGDYVYGREGAHSERRILHVGADATGFGLAQALVKRVHASAHVTVRPRSFALRLVEGGLLILEDRRGLVLILSPRIILAAGGLGQLFDSTTAPAEGTGDAIALALDAGIAVSDLEMVQFHPTTLAVRKPGASSLSLLSEALRGDGAVLVTSDSKGTTRELDTGHPMGSLGPRDVLSRAVFSRLKAGFPVFLDARSVPNLKEHFPTVTRLCAEAGLDPTVDLLPVVPAAHYTMGGVTTDLAGRSSRHGVWAVGEAARTGVHGANRLASNSLLECVVFGRAAAADAGMHPGPETEPQDSEETALPHSDGLRPAIQAVMGLAAGPVRNHEGLTTGLASLSELQAAWEKLPAWRLEQLTFVEARANLEVRNLLHLGRELLLQALARKDSLGAHFRSDSGSQGE